MRLTAVYIRECVALLFITSALHAAAASPCVKFAGRLAPQWQDSEGSGVSRKRSHHRDRYNEKMLQAIMIISTPFTSLTIHTDYSKISAESDRVLRPATVRQELNIECPQAQFAWHATAARCSVKMDLEK